jgi:diguanylate cyclase (GGDEF)-like protein
MAWPSPVRDNAVISRITAGMRIPDACIAERDRIVRMRVRALAPVIAALTIGWIALDIAVLPLGDAAPIAAVRLLIAASLLQLSRARSRLSAPATLRVFVWVQAIGFSLVEHLLEPTPVAGEVGYGLFPFVIVAQLALFPTAWPQTLRMAVAPAAALALMLVAKPGALMPADWRDAWLLVLLTAVAAWTAQALLRLLIDLQGARRDAAEDPLTGLANRRTLDARLAVEHRRVRRHGAPLSVLMLDLDRFKRVNDEYGHAAGDRVLAVAAGVLRDELRAIDLGARFGGEEFLAMLPDTPLEDAMRVAERVRRRIAAMPVQYQGVDIHVTVSIGVAQLDDGERIAEFIARADAALYEAKRGGRDRCVAAPAGADVPVGVAASG